jgi:hypothetical protein
MEGVVRSYACAQISYTRLQWECREPSPDLESDSCFLRRPIRFHVVLMMSPDHDNSFPLRQHLRGPA